jgi:hypothetical protein
MRKGGRKTIEIFHQFFLVNRHRQTQRIDFVFFFNVKSYRNKVTGGGGGGGKLRCV